MFPNDPNLASTSRSFEAADPMTIVVHQLERIISLIKEIVPKKEAADQERSPDTQQPSEGTHIARAQEEESQKHDKEHAQSDGNRSATDKKLIEQKLELYRATLNGDWKTAERIFNCYEQDFVVKISRKGDTALHIASGAKLIDFVKELVKRMSEDDVVEKNDSGKTALFFAAASGMVEVAEELVNKNKEIAKEKDEHESLPIEMAAALGHKEMVDYLYKQTKEYLKEENCRKLFVYLIEADLYDFAQQLLKKFPGLAIAHDSVGDNKNELTALHVLARKNLTVSKFTNQNQQGSFKRIFKLGGKDVENKNLDQALQLVKNIWRRVILESDRKISKLISEPENLIFDAAERGNDKFLSTLIEEYPDLIWIMDNKRNNYSIFHIAVKNRHEAVFKLIDKVGSKELFFSQKDEEGNNILHLAGMLAPSDWLNRAPGPAMQMKEELKWFEKVEKVVQRPRYAEARNKKGLTPRALFTEKHKDLRDKGEEWMNNTAGSCMIVAALIATVAFAAAITVPGGNNGDTGFPIFHEKISFKIFAISDAISLVFSSISIVTFLSITTSSYEEKAFLRLLPRKLNFGLRTLFISMAAMMMVFSITFFILFNDTRLWIAILVTVMASVPVLLFFFYYTNLYIPLYNFFGNLPFWPSKISLFGQQNGQSVDQRRMAKKSNGRQSTCCINV